MGRDRAKDLRAVGVSNTPPQAHRRGPVHKKRKPSLSQYATPPPFDTTPDGGKKAAARTKTKAHVAHNDGEHEWYTPLEYIESARRMMGDGAGHNARDSLAGPDTQLPSTVVGATRVYRRWANMLDIVRPLCRTANGDVPAV